MRYGHPEAPAALRSRPGPLGVLLAVASFLCCLPQARADHPREPVYLQLKWHHQFQFAGYYAAVQKGFYANEGLDVRILEGGMDHPPLETVLAGKALYGVKDSDLILARLKGKPVVACASIFQHSPYVLLSRKDSHIRTPADLVDKRVMLSDDQGAAQLRAMLLREGISPDRVKLIPHSWNLKDLVDKKVDAMSAYAMVEPHHLRSMGVEPSFLQAIDYGVDFYGDTLFTTEDESRHHPERVEALVRASRKGWEYALDHPEEITDLILAMPGVRERGVTRDILLKEAEGMRQFILPDLVEIGHMNEGRWQRIARDFADAGMIPRPYTLENFVHKTEPVISLQTLHILTWTGLALTLAIAFVILWNLQVRNQVLLRTRELQSEVVRRRLVEEQLREQATLLDKAQDAIIVRNFENRALFWNRSAERIYGWPRQEAVGQILPGLLVADVPTIREATRITRETGEWIGELDLSTKAGEKITVESRWSLVRDEQGEPKAILSIDTDITEKKKLATQYLRNQRMESIGTLAGGIAHDLNNVLTPILISIDLLQTKVTDEEGLKMLKTLRNCAKRGGDLVGQVVAFARGMEGQRVPVDLLLLCRDIRQIISETFPKNLTCQFECVDDLWTIIGDRTQIHQVLMNLCINARDAMPSGGVLTLSMENRILDKTLAGMNSGCKPGPYAVVSVADTGTGIPANIQDKVFEPFFTTKAVGSGTGLGLSTCAAIVKSHGGFIRLTSEPPHGTTFEVFFPAQPNGIPEKDALAGSSPLPRGRGETILVVDDEAGVRELIRKTLDQFNYRVLTASNGAEAVEIFSKNPQTIDLVLTDMAMPVMGGLATITALRSVNPDIRIVGSSGMADNALLATTTTQGVQFFIHKPYTADVLLQTIRSALEKRDAHPGRN